MPVKSVTQAECKNNMAKIMEKIDQLFNKISDLSIKVEGIPQRVLESADKRYASKASELRLNNLETRIEARSYDWLKYAIVTAITLAISFWIK